MRWLIFLHRYIGIAIGWLLVAWCLSGIVMMYVAYPEVTQQEAFELLPAIDFADCCALTEGNDYRAETAIQDFALEMLGDTPVLRIRGEYGPSWALNLNSGNPLTEIDRESASAIAHRLFAESGIEGQLEYLGENALDQWTVAGYFDADRPLQHFALNDAERTQWYISSSSGALVQATTRTERGWNWIGAVVHWSYPTLIRKDTARWIQFIVWTTLIGTFMALVGLYIGIMRIKRRRNGRWSPYRGIAWWHHYLGIVFGLLTLTWIVSGLLSVNPWGLLEGGSARTEAFDVRGAPMTWDEVRSFIERFAESETRSEFVHVQSAPFADGRYVVAFARDGSALRLSMQNLATQTLTEAQLDAAVPRLLGGRTALSAGLIHEDDSYYFNHHIEREFPVFRVIADDEEHTHYYLSATTGQLVQKTDSGRRWYRWLFEGAHRFDFNATMRQRPIWDILMLLLLTGVTGICITGTYMGLRFLARKL